MEGELIPNSFDFNSIPEGCVAAIIAFTRPKDACRVAFVSRGFRSASESDVVWKQFLPSDCDLIVSRSDGGKALLAEFRKKKKQLYMRLADQPLLVDDTSKSFWLEKSSGKKCWMVGARSLSIAWGDTPTYWKWTSIPESRFPEVAELVEVCWLDISVKIQTSMLSPGTKYAAYLVYKLTSNAYGFDALKAKVHSTGGVFITRVAFAESSNALIPNQRSDGWKELKIGEFLTHPREEEDDEVEVREEEDDEVVVGVQADGEVEVSVREVKVLNWKTGLIVQGIEVRPVLC